VFTIALPEDAGGAGGTVGDLAAALEELTLALAPGPVLPTVLAGLALAPAAANAQIREFLASLAEGTATATVVHSSPAGKRLVADWQADGSLRVRGTVGPVLSGGLAAHLLAAATTGDGDVWFLLPPGHPGVTTIERDAVDFSRPLATVTVDTIVDAPQILKNPDIGTEQRGQGVDTVRVESLAAALFSVEAAAVARWCAGTAAAYAKTRQQFGRPIGSFQAVKHLCANMLCRSEEAAALAWDAARAAGEAPDEFPLVAAAAAAKALDAAVDNAKDCIQVLGGIGFTWEHDAHLYLRRALALRHLLGGGAKWRERTAELALGGARRQLSLDVTGPAAEAARAVAAKVRQRPEAERRVALAAEGYVAPHWPAPYGIGASPGDILAIDQEFAEAGLARPDLVIGGWAGQAVVQYGTPQQRDRFLGPTVRGEITWCQLFSEPEAGSDLASLRTRAERTDSGWRLTGQKVWTSLARQADWAICLARTDPDVPKHEGISYFLVDMHAPGIDIRPLREITGRTMFNEVFLDQVFVPEDCVLGAPGDGWRIAMSTLAAERVAIGEGQDEAAQKLLATNFSERTGLHVATATSIAALGERGAHPAVRKLIGTAHRQAVAGTALDLLGPDGVAQSDESQEFLLTRCLSIAGGTTQILLNQISERVCGLPR
jgi:hypothetical protein